MTTTRSLHEKLATIRATFGAVEKTGEMKEGPRFKYVEARVIAARFVELCSAEWITMLPVRMEILNIRPTASGKQSVITLQVDWQITDGMSGETITVSSIGEGADSSDKAAPKAQTNAMKYAILLVLQKAADDAEADQGSAKIEADHAAEAQARTLERRRLATAAVPAPEPALASQKSKAMIRAKAREQGLDDARLKAFAHFLVGEKSSKDWTQADVDVLIAKLADSATVALFLEGTPLPTS